MGAAVGVWYGMLSFETSGFCQACGKSLTMSGGKRQRPKNSASHRAAHEAEKKKKRAKRMQTVRKASSVETKKKEAQRKQAAWKSATAVQKQRHAEHAKTSRHRAEPVSAEPVSSTTTSLDAKKYAEALALTCDFVMCACCGYESGLQEFKALTQELKEKMKPKMLEAWHTFNSHNKDSSFLSTAALELDPPGFLKGVTHVCQKCIKNGTGYSSWFVGKAPSVLTCLNQIEVSMISLVNPVVRFIVVRGGAVKCKASVFSITNDVQYIATHLPRMPGPEWAICRSKAANGGTTVCSYRPALVKDALIWLKHNNHLYQDITLDFDLLQGAIPVEVEHHLFDDDNEVHGDPSEDCEITEEFIHQNICNEPVINTMRAIALEKPPGDKVQPHCLPEYEALAFPVLFPYGKGYSTCLDMKSVRHRLTQVRIKFNDKRWFCHCHCHYQCVSAHVLNIV